MRQVIALFDEYQSRKNARNVLRAMKENARQGFYNGLPVPLGYRAEETEKRGARVIGDTATLEQVVAGKSVPAAGTRSFVREWRSLRESNSCFSLERAGIFSVDCPLASITAKQYQILIEDQLIGVYHRTRIYIRRIFDGFWGWWR